MMFPLKKILHRCALIAVAAAVALGALAYQPPRALAWATALVTCSSDDVKVAPDIYAQTLATYYQNQSVTVTGEISGDGIFARVSLPNGQLGWMKVVCVSTTGDGTSAPAPSGRVVTITTGALNVRSGAGWWYPVLATYYRGTTLAIGTYRNADASWVQVVLPSGQTGWVNTGYVSASISVWSLPVYGSQPAPTPTPPTTGTATITSSALEVRSGPGWWYGSLATYYAGTSFTLAGYRSADNAWVQVILPWHAATGWVNTGYVALNVPLSSLQVYGGTTPTPPPSGQLTHVVQAGENLYRIGLRYGVHWLQIAAANGIGYPYRIYAGQTIIIP